MHVTDNIAMIAKCLLVYTSEFLPRLDIDLGKGWWAIKCQVLLSENSGDVAPLSKNVSGQFGPDCSCPF